MHCGVGNRGGDEKKRSRRWRCEEINDVREGMGREEVRKRGHET